MDPVERNLLIRDLERYGYPLVHVEHDHPESVLLKMVNSDEHRILEGVPVVLTNMMLHNEFKTFGHVEERLESALKRRFRMLCAVTSLFLFWVPDSAQAADVLNHYIDSREPGLSESIRTRIEQTQPLHVGRNITLDAERLESTYKNYVFSELRRKEERLSDQMQGQREAALAKALEELFTEKQRSLVLKALKNEAMTKTEKEYFSRVIKRRLRAIRNADIQLIANALAG